MSTVSARKIRANRRNAKKSTGPKTPEGKAASSKNATTFGIFCSDLLVFGENMKDFHFLRESFLLSLLPHDMVELMLVDRIVTANWKLRRLRQAESTLHGDQYNQIITNVKDKIANLEEKDEDAKESRQEAIAYARRWGRPVPEDDDDEDSVENIEANLISKRAVLADLQSGKASSLGVTLYGAAEDQQPAVDRLSRYEQRLEGSIDRALRELERLRRSRKKEDELDIKVSPYQGDLKEIYKQIDALEKTKNEEEAEVKNEATESGDDDKGSLEEELASGGEPINTYEEGEDGSNMVESDSINAHGAAVGTGIADSEAEGTG